MLKHLRIKISGRVQGVFFRRSAKEEAEKLNINGFIKNEPQGTVYIEAEGEEENLKKFLKWCHKGPPLAKVETIDFVFDSKIKNFKEFVIIR